MTAIASASSAQNGFDVTSVPGSASVAANDGAFLTQTLSARVGTSRGLISGYGGYDSSRSKPTFDSIVEVQVWGPIALRAQTTYSDDTGRLRPSFGGRVQLLRQEAQGIDGSLTVLYKSEGFTEPEGEMETLVSVGRRFERLTLVGNLVYGQDPEGSERDGEVRAAALHQIGRFVVGVDSRIRMALGSQRTTKVEPKLDFTAGPIGVATLGPLATFAAIGPVGVELSGTSLRLGIAALGGIGASF